MKKFTILILALILCATLTGCGGNIGEVVTDESSAEDFNLSDLFSLLSGDSKTFEFDYGIKINLSNGLDEAAYELNDNETFVFETPSTDYASIYSLNCYCVSEDTRYPAFSLYVFGDTDWNDIELSSGAIKKWTGELTGYEVLKTSSNLVYVLKAINNDITQADTGLNDHAYEAYSSIISDFMFDMFNNYAGIIEISEIERTLPDAAHKTESVICDYGYFKLSIPTSWNYNDFDVIAEDLSESEYGFSGYSALYNARYMFHIAEGSAVEMFNICFMPDESYEDMIKSGYDYYKVYTDNGNTLAVGINNQCYDDDASEELKAKAEEMLNAVKDYNSFFVLD